MNCPKCNFEIPEGTFFCGECGTKIEITPLCKKCSTPLNGGVLFCPNCGTSASSNSSVSSQGNPGYVPQNTPEVILAKPVTEADIQIKEFSKEEAFSAFSDNVSEEKPNQAAANGPASTVKSREDIEENLERTMTIPIIKQSTHIPAERVPEYINPVPSANPAGAPSVQKQVPAPAAVPNQSPAPRADFAHPASATKSPTLRQAPPETGARRAKTQFEKKDDGQTQKNILIFLIVFLLVILIGLLSIILIMGLTGDKSSSGTAPGENRSASVDDAEQKAKNDAKETKSKDEDDKEDKDDKDNGKSKDKKNASSTLLPEDYIVKVDYDFDFAFGEDLDPDDHSTRRYMIYEDTDYFFECDVPSGFKNVFSDDVEVRYRAQDNTAYMDIGAYYNDADLSVEDVMDNTESSFGKGASYEASGDDWFVFSLEKDGIVYYQKCFVDDEYIRYFEFAYPEEYSDIYEGYITDIESNYKRTE